MSPCLARPVACSGLLPVCTTHVSAPASEYSMTFACAWRLPDVARRWWRLTSVIVLSFFASDMMIFFMQASAAPTAELQAHAGSPSPAQQAREQGAASGAHSMPPVSTPPAPTQPSEAQQSSGQPAVGAAQARNTGAHPAGNAACVSWGAPAVGLRQPRQPADEAHEQAQRAPTLLGEVNNAVGAIAAPIPAGSPHSWEDTGDQPC